MKEDIGSKNPPIMINREIAKRIVESAKKTINYDINIMNESGIIIASSDSARIGSFHEVAFQIINGPNDLQEIDNTEELIGTKKGINTILKYKDNKVGVLGITGDPSEIRPLIRVLKLAVETMIEYEFQQHEYILRSSQKNFLEGALIYGSATDVDLLKLATELKIDRTIYRIPLWINVESNISLPYKSMLIGILTKNKHYSVQDIITQWKENGLVIFKAFLSAKLAYGDYKNIIFEFLDEFLQQMETAGISAKVFTGSFCKSLNRYHESYKRALWLFENYSRASNKVEYFYDHINQWINSFIPMKELHDVFRFFVRDYDEKYIEQMINTEDALSSCDYNFERASQRLFVHKNTLFLWMNNFRKASNIDPVQNLTDRNFWACLCFYCRNKIS